MKTQLLIVEDDASVQHLLKRLFEQSDYRVHLANNGKEALFLFENVLPDIIILDLGLPDMEGLSIIDKVKQHYQTPILVLSAREDAEEKVICLDHGADDYVTKPFNSDELLARVRVLKRKYSDCVSPSNVYHNGGLRINYDSHQVTVDGHEVHLTPIEYKLLVLLSEHTGKVLTYKFILKAVWGQILESDLPSLRVFMTTLRKKIEYDPKNPQYIRTHLSVGYQMMKQEQTSF
ncbi:response regulator transcription factor [Staphylococcus chromogenes]|uniref:response regulator transcription factor n=1 Tax=Staphylococcus chromogenes TaxID=46126 RepID=UPI001E59696E|nr:response regulator transcription factor [Staphylococcus chromogenes]MCD8904212.1 response regulator transcription factor [Staphylococcus chromogenes]